MKTRLLFAILVLWQASSHAEPTLPTPATGASVDESRVEVTLYVDPANGEAADDDKHGTADTPFATLRYACLAAAKAKDANHGIKLILANGTYREAAEIPAPKSGKDTDAPLVIEAAERDQAVIDGADTEGWTVSTWKIENGRWTHPWPFVRNEGTKPLSAARAKANPAFRSGNLVFVDGVALRQVNTEAEVAPGTFFGLVSRGPAVKGRAAFISTATIQPPEDTAPEAAIVQVAVRPYGLQVTARRNVVVRGVMCQHAAAPTGGDAAVLEAAGIHLNGCRNVLVEDVLSQWNDGEGVSIEGGSDVTLRRVRALHNGGAGIATLELKNLLVEDAEASFNAFRGAWAAHVDPAGIGAVFAFRVEGGTWRRLHAVGNTQVGLDLHGKNLTVEEAVLHENTLAGLSVAASQAVLIQRCAVTGTKPLPDPGPKTAGTGGVVLESSQDVTLRSNVVVGNAAAQLLLWEWTTQTPANSSRHLYRHNVFCGLDATQFVCRTLDGDAAKGSSLPVYPTVQIDENCLWNAVLPEAFTAYSLVPEKTGAGSAQGVANTREQPPMDFERWQGWLAAHGVPARAVRWQDPLFVGAADGDFRVKEGSPVTGWELPAEDTASSQ